MKGTVVYGGHTKVDRDTVLSRRDKVNNSIKALSEE
jgi:hypothetical protein